MKRKIRKYLSLKDTNMLPAVENYLINFLMLQICPWMVGGGEADHEIKDKWGAGC